MLTSCASGAKQKKVFGTQMSVRELLGACSPAFQRTINPDHVDAIVRDVRSDWEKYHELTVQQSVTVALLRNTSTYHLLDGQHRLQAFQILSREDIAELADIRLPVVIYCCESRDEVLFWYSRINHHLPIHPLELELSWNEKVKPLLEFVTKKWRTYITKSERPVCPNVNLHSIQSVFEKRTSLLEDERITPERLIEDVVELNDEMRRRCSLYVSGNTRLQRCLAKKPEDPCFLGYWKSHEWVDFVLHRRVAGLRWETLDWHKLDCGANIAATVRQTIPKQIRRMVWAKCNDARSVEGLCYVCSETLHFDNMECGHDMPHHLGGRAELDNLWPLCRDCNRTMGIRRVEDFKRWYQSHLSKASESMVASPDTDMET